MSAAYPSRAVRDVDTSQAGEIYFFFGAYNHRYTQEEKEDISLAMQQISLWRSDLAGDPIPLWRCDLAGDAISPAMRSL
jgi:hypothetical protein